MRGIAKLEVMNKVVAHFNNAQVLSFAARRSAEMARLISNFGGRPLLAPVLRETPLENIPELDAVIELLQNGRAAWLILLSGSGTKVLLERLEHQMGREELQKVLLRTRLLARGPKPAHVLRQWGWNDFETVPEPNTWHELITVLDEAALEMQDATAIVQEFGAPHPELIAALQTRGAKVLSVPVYRWSLPDDLEPVQSAIGALLAGEIEVTLWTSAAQIRNVFTVASSMQCEEELRSALTQTLIGSIGPTTSAALRECGLAPTLEPQHPKMGHLIKASAAHYAAIKKISL